MKLQFRNSLDLQKSSLVDNFNKKNLLFQSMPYAFTKLFTINGVYKSIGRTEKRLRTRFC